MEDKSGRKMDAAWRQAISEGLKNAKSGISSVGSKLGSALKSAQSKISSGIDKARPVIATNLRKANTKAKAGMAAAAIAGGTAIDRYKAKGKSSAIVASENSKRKSAIDNLSTMGKVRRVSNQIQDTAKTVKARVDDAVMSPTGMKIGNKITEARQKAIDATSKGIEHFMNQDGAGTVLKPTPKAPKPPESTAAEKMRKRRNYTQA